MPSGPKMRCFENSANGMPLTRDTMIAARLKPVLLYDHFVPGSKLSDLLPRHDVEHVRVGVLAGRPRPAGNAFDAAPIAQPAGVAQHVANRQRLAVIGQLGNVLADRIVERELAVAGEQLHRHRGELLRHRSRLEDRVGRVANIVFQIGHAVGLEQHRPPANRDADRASRRGRCPLREDLVHHWARRDDGVLGRRDLLRAA